MMKNYSLLLFLSIISIISSCEDGRVPQKQKVLTDTNPTLVFPVFSGDSAYSYVKAQTDFGPRVPNTDEHILAGNYLVDKLSEYADTVYIQEFMARAYNATLLNGKNIIGSFNIKKKKRIFLAAHWDSRPYADQDKDELNHHQAIDGANDGASGVGILIEIARLLQEQQPEVGIDIVMFDLEDYGVPEFETRRSNSQESWALGSQYWAKNPHLFNYNAQYGILLDMVGAKDAQFRMEYFSMQYAPHIVKKVWKIASNAGYGDYFLLEDGSSVLDDHYFINQYANIPTIDIIQHDPNTASGFYKHWHTKNDNLENIDAVTLKAVGQVLIEVIFREK